MRVNRCLILVLIAWGLVPYVGVSSGLSYDTKLGLFLREEFGYDQFQDWTFYEQRFKAHIDWLETKKTHYKNDESYLRLVFGRTHRKFLLNYKKYAKFGEIFSNKGYYDCVTGTAFYALILDELGYQIEIRETEYHAYLLVHTEDKTFLFESTDPINGFTSDEKEMEERKEIVMQDAIRFNTKLAMSAIAEDNSNTEDIKVKVIDKSITIIQLAALQFYNQALVSYKQEDYRQAYQYIIIAQGIYPSDRIKKAASLMFAIAFGD